MVISESKRRILDVSLELFSKYGYEATSISQITNAVGIRKASFYSHFSSKQEIFDILLDEITNHFDQLSLSFQADWDNPTTAQKAFAIMPTDLIIDKVLGQVDFLIHDKQVNMVRKMLTIEQFRNEKLAFLMERRTYSDIVNFYTGMFKYLMKQNLLEESDPQILALLFVSPVSVQIYRIDRNPNIEEECKEIIRKHVREFWDRYRFSK